MRYQNNKRGQAILEMAIFGSIILFLFGMLLAYMQRQNDQQYVLMEGFRRALQKGCANNSSAQITLLENRRYADISGNFRKGSPNTLSSSSSVFWAVPKVGEEAQSILVFKVNEDEKVVDYRDFIPKEEEEQKTFSTGDLDFTTNTSFNETAIKTETSTAIVNSRSSTLQDTVKTTIPYKIKQKEDPDDYDDSNDVVLQEGTLWEVEQGGYVDTDGQYKYKADKVGTEVERSKTWETGF